ncbi:MAG TPA: hypothetical protein PLZ36_03920, partial [Armatimonadota bacterium]|nr:hypothetical protein [Armatimonadota bacterium]
MHCPTCATELSPDGACPRCARPPLVPPTPVLAAGAVVTGGNEYPPGLPYSMAEIRQACDYLSLIG